jgi:hypothetical protein
MASAAGLNCPLGLAPPRSGKHDHITLPRPQDYSPILSFRQVSDSSVNLDGL